MMANAIERGHLCWLAEGACSELAGHIAESMRCCSYAEVKTDFPHVGKVSFWQQGEEMLSAFIGGPEL